MSDDYENALNDGCDAALFTLTFEAPPTHPTKSQDKQKNPSTAKPLSRQTNSARVSKDVSPTNQQIWNYGGTRRQQQQQQEKSPRLPTPRPAPPRASVTNPNTNHLDVSMQSAHSTSNTDPASRMDISVSNPPASSNAPVTSTTTTTLPRRKCTVKPKVPSPPEPVEIVSSGDESSEGYVPVQSDEDDKEQKKKRRSDAQDGKHDPKKPKLSTSTGSQPGTLNASKPTSQRHPVPQTIASAAKQATSKGKPTSASASKANTEPPNQPSTSSASLKGKGKEVANAQAKTPTATATPKGPKAAQNSAEAGPSAKKNYKLTAQEGMGLALQIAGAIKHRTDKEQQIVGIQAFIAAENRYQAEAEVERARLEKQTEEIRLKITRLALSAMDRGIELPGILNDLAQAIAAEESRISSQQDPILVE
ncbi:hypothetical protein M407DRAFT_28081 [Tulasnella calospora MUT 4182]|uniref:Uncharacterized protein n=1 Tax=Tulasnella calospora MUT 4182 TaxID=1051891 RepID=A0A0C3QBC2_9AGAM|nr:hypothetical protein M407DRAFT_28081 [Tulasnella calospora MUT 4182]